MMDKRVTHNAAPGYLNVHYARVVLDYVRSRGCGEAQVLAALGVGAGDLDSMDAQVGLDRFEAALVAAGALCDDPDIGLHAGEMLRPAHLGPVGYALMSCPTVAEMIRQHQRFQALIFDGVKTRLKVQSDRVVSWLESVTPDYFRSRQVAEFSIVSRISFVRWISGRDLAPLHVEFMHDAPDDLTECRRILGDDVEFGHRLCGMSFPVDWLSLPIPTADPDFHREMTERVGRLLRRRRSDNDKLLARVRAHIANNLHRGVPSLEGLARDLNVTPRSLQRRLASLNLRFKDILDEVRRELALDYVQDDSLALCEVAFLLGYSDQSTFHRAFKRWTGQTPAFVRRH